MFLRVILAFTASITLMIMTPAKAETPFITVASTTSTQNSGLFDYILPLFTTQSGVDVRVVAVGTGQAIRMAKNGDADVLFVHHKASEEKFVSEGYGVKRFDVMYNDFVLVGPKADPAKIKGLTDSTAVLKRISEAKSVFVSRGDDSGTNKKELELWKQAGIDVKSASGTWYRESGSGMGATLNAAAGMSGYTMADRGTWIAFKNRKNLDLLSQGDKLLFNPYGVILVNAMKHPHVKTKYGQAFVDWLISPTGQAAISAYTVSGQQLFFANASAN